MPYSNKLEKNSEPEDIFSGISSPILEETKSATPDTDRPSATISTPPEKSQPIHIVAKKKKFGRVLIVVIGVVIIAFLAGCLYLIDQKRKANDSKNNSILEDQGLEVKINAANSSINSEIHVENNSNINPIKLEDYIDTDHDGVSDMLENKYGTKIDQKDSDNDDLSDREEIKVYLTDPLNPDSDQDSYLDGAEVHNGYNPKGPGKLYNIPKKNN